MRLRNEVMFGWSGENSALGFEELPNASFGVVHHFEHACAGKGLALARWKRKHRETRAAV